MKAFKTLTELVNEYAKQNLRSFFADLRYSGETRTISEIREYILNQRQYVLQKRVGQQFHPYTAKMENVPVSAYYIKNFGYVEI